MGSFIIKNHECHKMHLINITNFHTFQFDPRMSPFQLHNFLFLPYIRYFNAKEIPHSVTSQLPGQVCRTLM
jgi:hypothetical protein